jgi:uncharacterized protein involved in copper resistance
MKKLICLLFLASLCSCYHPQTVKTVVVAEKLTRNGRYVVVCSDGLNTYKITPYSRIALGVRVDMDSKTHTFKIVSDLNGKTNIGYGQR